MSRKKHLLGSCGLLFCCAVFAFAEQPLKYALVIGNGSYSELGKLKNPPNDAVDMADALKEIGFDVQLLTDANLETMEDAVVRLGSNLSRTADSIGFFFFAGHGVQSSGVNYLIPSESRIGAEAFLKTKALAAQSVLDILQGARNALNIVVIDACRDNPFSWARSGQRGLSVVGTQPPGSIIAYATSAGNVAQDGGGRNGVFTAELLKNIRDPDLEIKDVFNLTGRAVSEATAGKQIPAIYSQFFGDAHIASAGKPVGSTARPPQPSPAAVDSQPSRTEGSTADLVIAADVDGADVFIDGVQAGTAPNLFTGLPAGVEIAIEARRGSLSARQTVRLDPKETREITMKLTMERGNVFLQVPNPSAYSLWMDGEKRGPLGTGLIRDVPVGKRVAEIRSDGSYWRGEIEVKSGTTITVKTSPAEVGSLEIVASPSASVLIGSSRAADVQSAPQPIQACGGTIVEDLPIGEYWVIASGAGFDRVEVSVRIGKGERVKFTPWSASDLEVSTSPPGARISVNGSFRGLSPLTVPQLSAGTARVTASLDGYTDSSASVPIEPGKRAACSISLQRKYVPKIGETFAGGLVFSVFTGGGGLVLAPKAQNSLANLNDSRQYWNFTTYNGYSDWTLPTVEQLKTIRTVLYSVRALHIDSGWYWCLDNGRVKMMDMDSTELLWPTTNSSKTAIVRLVRGFRE